MTGLGRTSGFREIKGAIVLTRVNEEEHPSLTRGLFHGLLNIFLIAEESVSHEPIRVRIARDENTDRQVEKVNSLVGKKVNVLIHRSPWSASGKSGIINYLQSIEESS